MNAPHMYLSHTHTHSLLCFLSKRHERVISDHLSQSQREKESSSGLSSASPQSLTSPLLLLFLGQLLTSRAAGAPIFRWLCKSYTTILFILV